MEISIINKEGKVIWDNDFKRYKEYLDNLKNKTPDDYKMRKMESKFLNLVKNDKVVANYYKIAAGVGMTILSNSTLAYANTDALGGIGDKVKGIFDPIIELFANFGYPVTYMMIITGLIMVIMGKKSKGLEVIKWACIGYLGLQFVPFLLKFLDIVGTELRKAL